MFDSNAANTFVQEAEDLLVEIEDVALNLSPGEDCTEGVNRLFRAFHTIKGSGAMFGFEAVAAFTHHVESVLDKVRVGAAPVSSELLELILQARDTIKDLLGGPQDAATVAQAANSPVISALNALASGADAPAAGGATAGDEQSDAGQVQTWRIRFRPHADMLAHGGNPVLLLGELRDLGRCKVTIDTSAVPLLDEIEPDRCYVAWEIELETDRGLNAIRDVFIFVEDSSDLTIEGLGAVQEASVTDAAPLEATPIRAAAKETKAPEQRKDGGAQSTVRVASDRLDRLVNLVGELVMNQSRLTQAASRVDSPELAAPVEEIERLVAELRDNVLGIRMTPIGATFTRFKRLVHDLSAELGKDIELLTEGGETELDKTVLDQIGDPLVHLIRNSIDHGIESPEDRLQAGKAARGSILLAAVHTGSNVVVSVQDDGRGLNVDRIRAKAVERGLISADANLTESETFNLIFLPGFSTAAKVSGVSGRGVGMDVVKRQIETLRGSVSIRSDVGRGTTIALTLPLTLAIIDGLLVDTAGEQFILPMSVVAENVELHRSERLRNNGRNMVAVRGELVPYIDLRGIFQLGGREPDIEKIVIVRHDGQRVGLLVDRVIGSHQTVIQSLGKFFAKVDVFSGATIMGDGSVTLILDVAAVVRHADRQPHSEQLVA